MLADSGNRVSCPGSASSSRLRHPLRAGDGRESPLKYTIRAMRAAPLTAGDGRESPLKYTRSSPWLSALHAGDGRESPLKYTCNRHPSSVYQLGMAGNRRSSTLHGRRHAPPPGWGWPGIAAQVHYLRCPMARLICWGWPGIAAQVHWQRLLGSLFMAGDGRESPLKYTGPRWLPYRRGAGDGRESPLKYTS